MYTINRTHQGVTGKRYERVTVFVFGLGVCKCEYTVPKGVCKLYVIPSSVRKLLVADFKRYTGPLINCTLGCTHCY